MKLQDWIKLGEWLLIFIFLITITSAFNRSCSDKKYNELINLNKSQNDTIKKYRDKSNREHAIVEVMVATSQDVILTLQSKDSTINALKQVIITATNNHKKVEVAMKLYNSTITHLKDSIHNIISDSSYIENGDTICVYPTYSRTYEDTGSWIKGKVVLGVNKFELTQTIRNDYDFVLGREVDKKGFLGIGRTYKTYAEITNHNPYTETKDMKVYQKVDNEKKSKPILTSLTIGILIGHLIHILL